MKCLICKKNEADAKNSHIIPFCLLRRVVNPIDKKDRGYEHSYAPSLDVTKPDNLFIGSAMSLSCLI